MSSGIQTVTETHALCAICLEWFTHDALWVDSEGQKWDICQSCGEKERLMNDESPVVTEEMARTLVQEDGLDPSRANQLVGLTMKEATAKVVGWLREAEQS